MTRRHEVWLTRDDSTRLSIIEDVVSFSWNRVVNGISRCSVVFQDSFDKSMLAEDRRLEIWRAPVDGILRLENVYFIRHVISQTSGIGKNQTTAYGVGPNELLMRRIVDSPAGSAEARKTDDIDDMMKAIVRENMGALADADRDYTANGFTVAADLSAGPSATKSFAYRNVLELLQSLSETARVAGDQVYFAVVPVSTSTFEFRTFLDQPGIDRTTGINPITFSLDRGNLQSPFLEEDFGEEVNFVVAGGQGKGIERLIVTDQDDARINQSIWNRREAFRDARHQELSAGVTADAEARLAEGRPRKSFGADLLSIAGTRYGVDWDFGDRVIVQYMEEQFNGLVRVVDGKVDENGGEAIGAHVEVVSVT
jgi:hypothetical protein